MFKMFANYKDCQAWRDIQMPLYTTNNEACKMYDAMLRQMMVRREDDNIGGMEGAMEKLFQADQNFVMGHVFKEYSTIGEIQGENEQEASLKVQDLAKSQWHNLSNMEKGHCNALKYLGKKQVHNACNEWEQILVEYPKDTLALKNLYGYRLMLGEFEEQRDAVARVLPFYNKKTDLEYGYVVGMYAFGLEETHMYDQSEAKAKEALECDRHDAWATHTLAHVYEMTGRYEEGLQFMAKTKQDWEIIKGLACHNNWHRCLFHVEKGDIESCLKLYDEEVASTIAQPTCDMFALSDAISLLYRLKMEGIDVGKQRFRDVGEKMEKFVDLHNFGYYDACLMLGFCGSELFEQQKSFMQKIKDLATNDDDTDIHKITKTVNMNLCEAIQHFEAGEYDQAVEVLLPCRYKASLLGGSRAQRDVFNLLLIHAASKSQTHQKLAVQLLHERKALKCTPLTERLWSNVVKYHDS